MDASKYSEHTQILVAPPSDPWAKAFLGRVKEADCPGKVRQRSCPPLGHVCQKGWVSEGFAHKWRPRPRACALRGNARSLCGQSCTEASGISFSTQSPRRSTESQPGKERCQPPRPCYHLGVALWQAQRGEVEKESGTLEESEATITLHTA